MEQGTAQCMEPGRGSCTGTGVGGLQGDMVTLGQVGFSHSIHQEIIFCYKIDKKDGEGVVNLISPFSGPFVQLALCISFWCWQLCIGGCGT